MYRYLLLLLLIPFTMFAQSKRKKIKIALAKEKIEHNSLTVNLKNHIQALANDSLEGRRTGTKGELLAMNYLVAEYKKIGLEPGNGNNYTQEFEYDEGKNYSSNLNFFKINNTKLEIGEDYFPLAFSNNGNVKSLVSAALKESGEAWVYDLKSILEENKNNPHFDLDGFIKKKIINASSDGATALILINSSSTISDNLVFNKKDKSVTEKIPVVYLYYSAFKKYFRDALTSNKIELSIELKQQIRKGHNIIGYINNNATNTVILGAHYDHLGYGEDKNALDTFKDVHNGADDNASGSAALIELARLLKQSTNKNNNYIIIHFSGEELGLIGSKYWLENPTINVLKNYMINMDMIGRYDTTHKLTIGGFGTSPVWGDILPTIKTNILIKYDSTGGGPSDHASFYRKDIPVLFFFTGSHSDYHKISDDYDKINYEAEANIIKYIYNIISITDSKGKLIFAKTSEPTMGKSGKFTVSLGVIPDYGFSESGVRIDGVSPGKIAEKIGLQSGDILLQLGDNKFTDVMSYMQTLGKFKKGDKTTLLVKRKDEIKEYEITF